jgi:toxin ParE1/3/4
MKKYTVHFMNEAEQDLWELYSYVARNDSIIKAENLVSKIEEICFSLEHFPERGHVLAELQRIANTDYREIYFKPYRVVYKISDNQVYIHCILDGRRNLEYLLLQRLIGNQYH